jgi:hypothetical protein
MQVQAIQKPDLSTTQAQQLWKFWRSASFLHIRSTVWPLDGDRMPYRQSYPELGKHSHA